MNEHEYPILVLIGNKIDLSVEERKVSKEEAQKFADTHKLVYHEVSAKENTNIKNMFLQSFLLISFFDQYRTEFTTNNMFIEEIEKENGGEMGIFSSTLLGDTSRINISMTPHHHMYDENNKCKC